MLIRLMTSLTGFGCGTGSRQTADSRISVHDSDACGTRRGNFLRGSACLIAGLMLACQTNAQEPVPAPPEGTAEVVPESTPAAPATDGVARVPVMNAQVGCGPVANAGCGPQMNCGPNGYRPAARQIIVRPDLSGCNQCNMGECNTGACQSGVPCYYTGAPCMDSMAMAGRPYTLGDLKNDFCAWKYKTHGELGLLNGDSGGGGACDSWWAQKKFDWNCKRAYYNQLWGAHLKNKFNYFVPSGCCGEGCPPAGYYQRVYAVQPYYADPRDQQVYGAPATGVPTAVPLAPNVHYQMNYGWGIPSSRLTPVSNVTRPRF